MVTVAGGDAAEFTEAGRESAPTVIPTDSSHRRAELFTRLPFDPGRRLFLFGWLSSDPTLIGDVDDRAVRSFPFFLEEAHRRRDGIPRIDECRAQFAQTPPRSLDVFDPETEMTHAESRGAAILSRRLGRFVAKASHVERAVAQKDAD